ncbi:hypothetical protein RCL_jg12530.t1 [Rhizophagus clarus]|uniref:Uncharacterized protein n=1 Tax=Rhizophagus clarus TaxID=94130 RepID=A0A8H3LQP1_9GLOM|nr:hypothetical protein RCL_jg12530.t1 [Rhizophagus clarus]
MENKFISQDALQKHKARENESSSKRKIRLANGVNGTDTRAQDSQLSQQDSQDRGTNICVKPNVLSESERKLLKKFCDKVDKFKHAHCPTCNEKFPSILKENNQYYFNITIDYEALQSLPIDSSIDDKLQDIAEESNFENKDDMITRFFVPILPPSDCEDVVIQNSLN